MYIESFIDKDISQISYAIRVRGKIVLVDPARDPSPYYKFAESHKSTIVAIIETHSHADFVSSHLEIHKTTKAPIYISGKARAEFPHIEIVDNMKLELGEAKLEFLETPGHSQDSICILAHSRSKQALFTGDTILVGDVGRPDLRESGVRIKENRISLAKSLYQSINTKILPLPKETIIYPAHGPGSLCAKNISKELSSTLKHEIKYNIAFRLKEEEFITYLLEGQPFIPNYFPFDVDINRKGAENFEDSISTIPTIVPPSIVPSNGVIIDTREAKRFQRRGIPQSINIPLNPKFQTWMGTLLKPETWFYLAAYTKEDLESAIYKSAKIGYESYIKGGFVIDEKKLSRNKIKLDIEKFKANTHQYTIIDVRSKIESEAKKIFRTSINIPLNEMNETKKDLDTEKPIVVHCASGYRSGIATSLLMKKYPKATIYDLGKMTQDFQ